MPTRGNYLKQAVKHPNMPEAIVLHAFWAYLQERTMTGCSSSSIQVAKDEALKLLKEHGRTELADRISAGLTVSAESEEKV